MSGLVRNGFTLVEMLVALVIFALLAAGGVGLLRASVATQDSVETGLARLGARERVIALLQADAGQAIARPLSGVGDARQLPFEGIASRASFVRAGWANPGQQPRSSLQRVDWALAGDDVTRTAHVTLESSGAGQPAALLGATGRLSFRYRRNNGEWVTDFRSGKDELLPAAIEATIAPLQGPPLVIVAAFPPRGPEPRSTTPQVQP